jgi:hypothetical protein
MHWRAAGRAMRLGASSRANATVLSKPPRPAGDENPDAAAERAAAIQPSYGCATCWAAALTAASMRCRRAAEMPFQADGSGAGSAPGRERQRPVKPNVPGGNGWLAVSSFPDRDLGGVCQSPVPKIRQARLAFDSDAIRATA